MVVDEGSRKLIDNVLREDDILNENVTSKPSAGSVQHPHTHNYADIEQIETKRPPNPTTDAVYLLSPLPHIVDCLMADFERRRYRKAHLIWTSGQWETSEKRRHKIPYFRQNYSQN